MEKEQSSVPPVENMQVVHNPEPETNYSIEVYNGASMLQLTKEESEQLSARFEDDEIEIRPDGFLYVPQALIRQRLNKVIGPGAWSIVLLREKIEPLKENSNKLYFDGALMIRGKFVARSIGEASYFTTNQNQSRASALEAAKSDCMVRCVKDLGIALEVYEPAFCRKWQKQFAKKVWVKEPNRDAKTLWRRSDVDPFPYETGDWVAKPTVAQKEEKKVASPITEEWKQELANRKTPEDLIALYNQNKKVVDEWPELKVAFKQREIEVKKK